MCLDRPGDGIGSNVLGGKCQFTNAVVRPIVHPGFLAYNFVNPGLMAENDGKPFQHRNHKLALRPHEGPPDATIWKDSLMQHDVHRPAAPELAKQTKRDRPKLSDVVPGEVNL